MTGDAYSSSSAWNKMKTASSPAGTYVLDEEVATTLEVFGTVAAQAVRSWDIRPLAEAGLGEVEHVYDEPSRPIKGWKLHGITMVKVVELQGQTISTSYKPGFYHRAMTVAGCQLQQRRVGIFCPECPFDFSFLGKELTNPVVIAGEAGLEEVPSWLSVSAGLDTVFDQAIAGDYRIIEASEPLALLANEVGGAAVLRGIAFAPTSAAVPYLLESGDVWEIPEAVSHASSASAPTLYGNEGVALSGMLRTVLVVGGTARGQPLDSAYMLNIDENTWITLPHSDERVDLLPGEALGVAFRSQDYQYYLSALSYGEPYLWRYRPREERKLLGELPLAWLEYERHWLVSGAAGDLVFVGSSPRTGGLLLARFVVNEHGSLEFRGMLQDGGKALLARPIVTHDGVVAVVKGRQAHMAAFAFAEFGSPATGQGPTLY